MTARIMDSNYECEYEYCECGIIRSGSSIMCHKCIDAAYKRACRTNSQPLLDYANLAPSLSELVINQQQSNISRYTNLPYYLSSIRMLDKFHMLYRITTSNSKFYTISTHDFSKLSCASFTSFMNNYNYNTTE
jgi:hypothetical protein